ncbi:MAG: DUF6048 family protein [Paramuribaculum sp.]
MNKICLKIKQSFAPAIPAVLLALCLALPAMSQRKITPVRPKPSTTQPVNTPQKVEDPKANLAEMLDAQGNVVLVDTITGKEWVDSTANDKELKRMKYPLLESVSVGLNIWDPVMRLLGQHYGGADVWAELSLHNRYKPVVEFGLGACNDTPDGQNYTFKTKLAPYFRLGMNYNMFFNNTPAYQLNVGVRYGFTTFNYSVENIDITNDYWGEQETIEIPSQHCTAGFFEFIAGVRVKIAGPISLGWNVKYHALLHESNSPQGKPMYIPGYGKRGGSFSGSFSIIYTLPLNKSEEPAVITQAGH